MGLSCRLSWWGSLVGKYAVPLLAVAAIFGAASIGGTFVLPKNMIEGFDEGFSRPDSPSVREAQTQASFFSGNISAKPWYMALFAEPRNASRSMLNEEEFGELRKFYGTVKENLVIMHDTRGNFTYLDYCGHMCNVNDPLFKTYSAMHFLNKLKHGFANWFDSSPEPDMAYEWPVTPLHDYKANIGRHLFIRQTDNETNKVTDVKVAAVYFMLFVNSTEMKTALHNFEVEVGKAAAAHNANDSRITNLIVHSEVGMKFHIERGAVVAQKYIAAGLALLVAIVVIGLSLIARVHSEFSLSVILLALGTLAVPVFSMASATFLYQLIGAPMNTLFFLAPLVGLALAVDGAFVLFHSWLTVSMERIYDGNGSQMGAMFLSGFPSVMVELLLFVPLVLGILFPIPAFADISLFLGFVLLFTLVYLVFLFCPLLVVLFPIRTHEPVNGFELADRKEKQSNCMRGIYRSILGWLSTFYTSSTLVLLAGAFSFLLLASVSFYGIRQVKSNLDYREVLLPDAPTNRGVEILSDVVWPDMLHIMFFIGKPPNFTDPIEYGQFKHMMTDLESIPHAFSKEANMKWIDDYKRYIKQENETEVLDMTRFPDFITDDIYKAWNSGVRYHLTERNETVIDRMMVMIAVNDTHSVADKAVFMTRAREIASSYDQFDVVPFDTEVATVDTLLQLPSVLLLLPILSYVCLFVFIFGLTWNVTISVLSTITTVSIFAGTVGICSLLSIYLNPVTVSILFFVSLTSARFIVHLSFHYYFAHQLKEVQGGDHEARMERALEKSALPVFLSCLTGSILFLPLLFISIILYHNLGVILLVHLLMGIVHAFFLLPLLLAITPRQFLGKNCLVTRY